MKSYSFLPLNLAAVLVLMEKNQMTVNDITKETGVSFYRILDSLLRQRGWPTVTAITLIRIAEALQVEPEKIIAYRP